GMFQAFFDTAQDAMFVIEAATRRIVHVSAQAAHESGYAQDQLVGLDIGRVLRERDGAPCGSLADHGLRSDMTPRPLWLIGQQGEAVPVSVSAIAFKWTAVSHVLLIVHESQQEAMLVASAALTPEREDFPSI